MTSPTTTSSGTPAVALTIAGSGFRAAGKLEPQADLVTFAALGVHGASAVTALTAQNTLGVSGVHVPPVEVLRAQIDAVLTDLPVAAVQDRDARHRGGGSGSGRVSAAGACPTSWSTLSWCRRPAPACSIPGPRPYREALFPQALVVTPNTREAPRVARDAHRVARRRRRAAA